MKLVAALVICLLLAACGPRPRPSALTGTQLDRIESAIDQRNDVAARFAKDGVEFRKEIAALTAEISLMTAGLGAIDEDLLKLNDELTSRWAALEEMQAKLQALYDLENERAQKQPSARAK